MGVQLFPTFDREVPDVMSSDGKLLARAFPDDEQSALWPLVAFVSSSPADVLQFAEEIEAGGQNVEEIMAQTTEEWFAPGDAIAALDAILERVRAAPELLNFPPTARISDPSEVIKELRDLRSQLQTAEAANARFHLQFCF